jgi:polysaccharide biosynthesis transport protein
MLAPEGTSPREASLLQYWRVLRKRQWTAIAFALILAGTVAVGTLLSTPYYSSSAIIEIASQAPTVLDVEEVSDVVSYRSADERRAYYATQYRIISSRSTVGETIRRLREEQGITDFDDLEDPIGFLMKHVTVDPQSDTRLVKVTVEYPDPDKAALFANTLAQTYMEMNLQRALDASETALSWLREQQEVYRQRKYSSDNAMHQFKYEANLELAEATRQKLAQLETAWSGQHTERVQLEATYQRMSQQAKGKEWLAVANSLSQQSAVLGGLLQAHQGKLRERDELSARYLADHPKVQRVDKEVSSVEEQIRRQMDDLLGSHRATLQAVQAKESALEGEMEAVRTALRDYERKEIEYGFLQSDATRNEGLFQSLDRRLAEVDLTKVITANNIWFIDRAYAVATPVRPRLGTNLPVALVIGVLGGVGLAFFMEYVDSTIKSREDLEEVVGVPFLGAVPVIERAELAELEDDRDKAVFVHARPRSSVAENLRSIRTNILFRLPDTPQRRLLITSAAPKEGKSYCSSNLSAVIAMTGSRVLLIDADLRRPTQHAIFKTDNELGLSNALLGTDPVADCITRTHVPGLDLMPSGPRPPNPAELLGSDAMRRLLDGLKQYDFVIIDSSPVGAVADPLILSRMVQGVLMVVESNKTGRDQVLQTQFRLREMNANILGAIVNKLNVRKAGYAYYYYYDYNSVYYDTEVEPPRRTG